MKTLLIMSILTLANFVYAQNTTGIVDNYMKVKDALVKSDYVKTAEYSLELQKTIESSEKFKEKSDLLCQVKKMAKAKDIEKQRTAFASVSKLLWAVVKKNNELERNIYYQYCPMKKMYWLSWQSDIQNPYYGSKMLTCGNVADKKIK